MLNKDDSAPSEGKDDKITLSDTDWKVVTLDAYDGNKFIGGIDPYNEGTNDSQALIIRKGLNGESVVQYFGRPEGVLFPELIKDMLKYYPNLVVKERTDEDIRNELKAIAMFNPKILKDFLENDYERIINKEL